MKLKDIDKLFDGIDSFAISTYGGKKVLFLVPIDSNAGWFHALVCHHLRNKNIQVICGRGVHEYCPLQLPNFVNWIIESSRSNEVVVITTEHNILRDAFASQIYKVTINNGEYEFSKQTKPTFGIAPSNHFTDVDFSASLSSKKLVEWSQNKDSVPDWVFYKGQ